MTSPTIRILGITTQQSAVDFRRKPHGKHSGLFAALDRRFAIIDVLRPELPRYQQFLGLLQAFHPNRATWRRRFDLSSTSFSARSRMVEQELQRRAGSFDVLFQLHTLLAPGRLEARRPFVLHTDNTSALSARYYPPWALSGRVLRERLQNERRVYTSAAYLFPRSEFLRRSMIDDYGCDPARVIVVGAGANLVATSIADKRYDSQVALFVGIDFARKGGQVLLDAWPAVRRALPAAQLWVVGPKQAPATVPAGVRWFGRVHNRQQLADLYRQAAVFVLPPLFEPWGFVFHEAMGYGLPCIGSTCCAIPEIIDNGATGLLVPPGAPEPLANALIALLGDPHYAEALGRRAYAAVLNGHTWDDVVARMAPFIEQLR